MIIYSEGVGVYLLLFLFFVILNGKLTVEILLVGLAAVLLLAGLLYLFFGYMPKKDLRVLTRLPLLIVYVFLLIIEIIKATASVIRLIVNPKSHFEPTLVTFRPALKTDIGRFILANSITLTPGTITVDIQEGVFTVHCLDRGMLDTSEDSVFIRWIKRMEG